MVRGYHSLSWRAVSSQLPAKHPRLDTAPAEPAAANRAALSIQRRPSKAVADLPPHQALCRACGLQMRRPLSTALSCAARWQGGGDYLSGLEQTTQLIDLRQELIELSYDAALLLKWREREQHFFDRLQVNAFLCCAYGLLLKPTLYIW